MRRFTQSLIVTATLAAALLPAGVAQARPVPEEPVYVAPGGSVWVPGWSNPIPRSCGAACI